MTEALLSIGLAGAVFACLAGVLQDEWDRTRCSVVAFESAHRHLIDSEQAGYPLLLSLGKRPQVRLSEDPVSVSAEVRCGRALERVNLIKLEAAEW